MKFIKVFLLSMLATISMFTATQSYAVSCNGFNDTTTCVGTGRCVEVKKAGTETKCFLFWCWEEGVMYTKKGVFECSNSCGSGTDLTCSSDQTCNPAGFCVDNPPPPPPPSPCVPSLLNAWCGFGFFQ